MRLKKISSVAAPKKKTNKKQNIHITQAVQPIDFHAIKPKN